MLKDGIRKAFVHKKLEEDSIEVKMSGELLTLFVHQFRSLKGL